MPDTARPETLTVPSVPRSVAAVRRFAVTACVGCPDEVRDTVALLVSEVATNALVHGNGDVEVSVRVCQGRLRVEVSDGSSTAPQPRSADPEAEGGRGLALVDALSSSWGTELTASGKTVWFEVST